MVLACFRHQPLAHEGRDHLLDGAEYFVLVVLFGGFQQVLKFLGEVVADLILVGDVDLVVMGAGGALLGGEDLLEEPCCLI